MNAEHFIKESKKSTGEIWENLGVKFNIGLMFQELLIIRNKLM